MTLKPIAAVLLLGTLLTGCDQGTGHSAGSTVRPDGAVSYDFYLSGQTLYAVNRNAAQQAPQAVDTLAASDNAGSRYLDSFQDEHWLFSTANFGSHGANNIQTGALLYVNGKHFFRLTSHGSKLPAPQQVSAEAQADRLCEVATPHLLRASLEQFELKYHLPGKDGRCDNRDDVYKRIRFGMQANEAPETISETTFFAAGIIGSNDRVKWYLALDDDKLVRYDARMGNATTLLRRNGMDELSIDSEATDGKHSVLRITSGNTPGYFETLYVIDNESGKLSPEISNVRARRGGQAYLQYIGAQAGQHYYLANENDMLSFIRFSESGSSPATTIASGVGTAIGFAGGQLIYTSELVNATEIRAIDVTARNPAASDRLLKSGANLAPFAVAQGRVFYNLGDSFPVHSYSAGSIKVDGSGEVSHKDARWVGYTTANSFTSAFATPLASRLILARHVNIDAQGLWSGGELYSAAAATAQPGTALGRVPAEVGRYNLVSADYDGSVIGHGYSADATQMHLLISSEASKATRLIGTDPNRVGWLTDWLAAH